MFIVYFAVAFIVAFGSFLKKKGGKGKLGRIFHFCSVAYSIITSSGRKSKNAQNHP